jgi:hypothetical protein
VLSGLYSAPASFAGGDVFVISESSAPTIFSSRVDAQMLSALSSVENITGASGEVFAFASYRGVSFVVRGTGDGFGETMSPEGDEIEWAEGYESLLNLTPRARAVIGKCLYDRIGVELPFTAPLAGSYTERMEIVNVLGVFETGSALDDELLVTNDVARRLSGMGDDRFSIIRVTTDSPDWLSGLLSPENARFTLSNLRPSHAMVGAGAATSISVDVHNWGGSAGTVALSLSDGEALVGSYEVALNASSHKTISTQFELESLGRHTIRANLSGDFPVVLYTNITVVEPYLTVSAPKRVMLGSVFGAVIRDHVGALVADAVVTFQNQTAVADGAGEVSFTAYLDGSHAITAAIEGFTDGSANVNVVDPADYPDVFNPSLVSFVLQPTTITESETARVTVVVENNGTVGGSYGFTVKIDSVPELFTTIDLLPMQSVVQTYSLPGLSAGTHVVQAENFSEVVTVEAWYADDMDLIELVLRYGGSNSLSPSGSVPIYQAAKISEGNVATALFAIGAISGLLSVLAITSIFSKEIRERRRTLGILRTLGASDSDLRSLVFPQALGLSVAGALIGIALGAAVTTVLSDYIGFVVFGHSIEVGLDGSLLFLILLGAGAISIASSLVATAGATREGAVASIRGLSEDAESNETAG